MESVNDWNRGLGGILIIEGTVLAAVQAPHAAGAIIKKPYDLL